MPLAHRRQSALVCTARRVPFSSALPLAPCGPGAFLLPFTRQRQAVLACTARRVPFLRLCLRSPADQGLFSSAMPLVFCGPGAFFVGHASGLLRARGFPFAFGSPKASGACLCSASCAFWGPVCGAFFHIQAADRFCPVPPQVCPAPIFQNPDTTKNAPYDQRPNGAVWWALRNSNPYKFTLYRKIFVFLCICCVFCLKIRSV